MNKNKFVSILSLMVIASLAFPLSSCGDTSNGSSSNSSNSSSEPLNPNPDEGDVGITPRPDDDLTDFDDNLRPDRNPDVEDKTPIDDGELVDHIYQFEEMNIVGGATGFADHYCLARSYAYDPMFDGSFCLEGIDPNTKFTLTIASDKAVNCPLEIKMSNNYCKGATLESACSIKNNRKKLVDTSVLIPEEGVLAPYAPAGYFDMVTTKTTISLEKGINKITFIPTPATNFDSINIKTSANIENKTTINAAPIDFVVTKAPTFDEDGTILQVCGRGDDSYTKQRTIAKLSDPHYEMVKVNGIDTYKAKYGNKDVYFNTTLTSLDDHKDMTDKGELTDHVFEFEKAKITGNTFNSQGKENNHICGEAFIVNPELSGHVAIKNIDENNSFEFEVTSDKEVVVPFDINMKSLNGSSIDSALKITNNNKEVNGSFLTQTQAKLLDLGEEKAKYPLTTARGLIGLEKGLNTIKVTPKGTTILDSLNIRTSATLADSTVSTLTEANYPSITITKVPSVNKLGSISVGCKAEGCNNSYSYALPSLINNGYIKKEVDGQTSYYLEPFGVETLIATINSNKYPMDEGELKENYFEFENAEINGFTKPNLEHFCVVESLTFAPEFSGNICLENLPGDKAPQPIEFTWKIQSDKRVTAPFTIRTHNEYVTNHPLGDSFIITNNGDDALVDSSQIVDSTIVCVPDVGWKQPWFNMVDAKGLISLEKGLNVIKVAVKTYSNVDFFKIDTSANLTNVTNPTLLGENHPTFEVVQAPTMNSKGILKSICHHEGTHGDTGGVPNVENFEQFEISALTSSCYEKTSDGYYLELCGQKIKVAEL